MLAGCFYSKKRTNTKWLAPVSSAHSDIEVEDDALEEDFDDDVLDPDFLLDIPDDDLTPTASGKHTQQMFFKWPRVLFGRRFKWPRVLFGWRFLKGRKCLLSCNF